MFSALFVFRYEMNLFVCFFWHGVEILISKGILSITFIDWSVLSMNGKVIIASTVTTTTTTMNKFDLLPCAIVKFLWTNALEETRSMNQSISIVEAHRFSHRADVDWRAINWQHFIRIPCQFECDRFISKCPHCSHSISYYVQCNFLIASLQWITQLEFRW